MCQYQIDRYYHLRGLFTFNGLWFSVRRVTEYNTNLENYEYVIPWYDCLEKHFYKKCTLIT